MGFSGLRRPSWVRPLGLRKPRQRWRVPGPSNPAPILPPPGCLGSLLPFPLHVFNGVAPLNSLSLGLLSESATNRRCDDATTPRRSLFFRPEGEEPQLDDMQVGHKPISAPFVHRLPSTRQRDIGDGRGVKHGVKPSALRPFGQIRKRG